MIKPIQINQDNNLIIESFDSEIQPFTEAVFVNGKKTLEPILEDIKAIKNYLNKRLDLQDDTTIKAQVIKKNEKDIKNFNFKSFFKSELFKKLETDIEKIFGFRYVSIEPTFTKYNSKSKDFTKHYMNCSVYKSDRYPVEGLVTDKGFYDKSKSLTIDILIGTDLIDLLTPEELLAVFLHEFGHSIDPALVNIKYTETNILVKYLTDRKKELKKEEKTYIEKHSFSNIAICGFLIGMVTKAVISTIVGWLIKPFAKWQSSHIINKVQKLIRKDKDEFNRYNAKEAFADNFARMYGYGPQLISGLNKMDNFAFNRRLSRISFEMARQNVIGDFICHTLNDVHKTNIHRARSLIKEYKKDIADTTIPAKVREQLKDDLNGLENLMSEYLNNFSSFQNKVNRLINEELEKMDLIREMKDKKKK